MNHGTEMENVCRIRSRWFLSVSSLEFALTSSSTDRVVRCVVSESLALEEGSESAEGKTNGEGHRGQGRAESSSFP